MLVGGGGYLSSLVPLLVAIPSASAVAVYAEAPNSIHMTEVSPDELPSQPNCGRSVADANTR